MFKKIGLLILFLIAFSSISYTVANNNDNYTVSSGQYTGVSYVDVKWNEYWPKHIVCVSHNQKEVYDSGKTTNYIHDAFYLQEGQTYLRIWVAQWRIVEPFLPMPWFFSESFHVHGIDLTKNHTIEVKDNAWPGLGEIPVLFDGQKIGVIL
ncbi:MAG: hypothetical protein LBD03_01040 [Methanobrevibacter sp.]|jgi:hypothetical protein|nr:hypothetical protein [Candidatus Methanovirga procula]